MPSSACLAHYAVQTLDPSPELEESLLWIYKSHQRIEQQVTPVLGILERRLRCAQSLAPHAEESFRTLLDRMISMTGNVFPTVSDLAREVRYRYFEQPLFERMLKQVNEQVENHLDYIAAHPDAPDIREKIHALVECPQPTVRLFSMRFACCRTHLREAMLEVLTWRHYRNRALTNLLHLAAGWTLLRNCGI